MNFIILACVLGGVIESGTSPEVPSVLVVPSADVVVIESITVDPVVDLVLGDCCDCECDCFVVEEVPEPLNTDVGYLVGTGWGTPRATGSPLGSVGSFGGRGYPVSGGGGVGGFGGGGGSSSSTPSTPVVPGPGSFVLFGLGLLFVVSRMYPVGCTRSRT